jgi:hypothetical protein
MHRPVSLVFYAFVSVCTRSVLSLDLQYDTLTFKPSDIIDRDVAIVGGGSSGTHAAIALKDKGKTILVIENKARLGGHTETYTDPVTGLTQDYGVLIFHNTSIVRDYFQRFNIPLIVPNYDGLRRLDYDLRTGKPVNISHPSEEAIGVALGKYAAFLSQYPQLDKGMFLPTPVPEDLTMPFGKFASKYGIEDGMQTFYGTNQGVGDFLTLPVLENARVTGLSLIQQLASNGLLQTARNNNSELYGKAQAELLSVNSLLLSSEVKQSTRTDRGVELIVQTPDGVKYIRAKKLLITIPPRLEFLRPFDLQDQEREVFGKLVNAGYYAALIKSTGLPDDFFIRNYTPDTPYNLPLLPCISLIQPTAIPGLKAVYFGTQRSDSTYPVPDATVKAEMIAALKRLQSANPSEFKKTEPEIVVYTSHAPFYLQAKPEDTKAGLYDKMYALQGLKSTYWGGAAFRAHDSSMLWRFNEEEVLPKILNSL